MQPTGRYCPFLNRADSRCAEHFQLDKLAHAYRFCFGQYKSCQLYFELLVERRVRQREAIGDDHGHPPVVQVTISSAGTNAARAA